MILAGDVGGTKCNLALFQEEGLTLRPVFQRRFATKDFRGLEEVVRDFRAEAAPLLNRARRIEAAGFGLAGTVVEGCLHAGNVQWELDIPVLAASLGLQEVVLLNDITATALSIDKLSAQDVVLLNPGLKEPRATKAVLAAGTGLGEAILLWDGEHYRIAPSEGGLADFAPRTAQEIRLLAYCKERLPNVSCEEILSGRGFRRIHEFLDGTVRHGWSGTDDANAARDITRQALAGSCSVCVETVDIWAQAYGSEAGNLALRTLALGGIYLAGGIAPKILSKLKDGAFLRAFCDKATLASVLARIPVYVIMNEDAPIWGAAYQALARSRGGLRGASSPVAA